MPFETQLDEITGDMAAFLRRTGLTVNSAARELHVHRNTISNYLYNRKEPEYILRMAMAAYLAGLKPFTAESQTNQ